MLPREFFVAGFVGRSESATLVGSATNSSVSFNIAANDFSALGTTLRQHGVSDEDVGALELAVAGEAKPATRDKFGPKVAAWMGKMLAKAADSSWQIGLVVAGDLLSQAIGRYYGF